MDIITAIVVLVLIFKAKKVTEVFGDAAEEVIDVTCNRLYTKVRDSDLGVDVKSILDIDTNPTEEKKK